MTTKVNIVQFGESKTESGRFWAKIERELSDGLIVTGFLRGTKPFEKGEREVDSSAIKWG